MSAANIFKVTDDRFSIERIEDYDLLMEIQQTRFKFLLREKNSKTVIWLEDHYLGSNNSPEVLEKKLKTVFAEHEFLKANFWNSISLTIDFPCFCSIPQDFYDSKLANNYLKIQYPELIPSEFEIVNFKLNEDYLLFGIPKRTISFFQNYYPSRLIAYSNSLLNSLKYFHGHERIQNKNLLILNDEWLEAIYKEPKTGNIKTEKITLKSKNLRVFLNEIETQGQIKTLIFGEITPFSSIFRIIRDKLKALEFGGLPRNIKLSQYFSEIPEQRYFTLMNVDF
ncbi:DUF3822 family protein [Lacihabitans soyangensis]|uniref:DUF3822 family protein n=1 Tax=Lacihabitans soyangensis TaxID=869394 RepID=A0AAE3KSJ4_9BACT|nr:DUF3822 family protein [Lacihabitans soyangensis]MCP9763432.1 DUF3822 family protein [Lacihabitans soyangensis]